MTEQIPKMVERVARELRDGDADVLVPKSFSLGEPDDQGIRWLVPSDALVPAWRADRNIEKACQIIEAMREPTEEMIAEQYRAHGDGGLAMEYRWKTMIDAAQGKSE